MGALTFADISHIAGMIAAGILESPISYFDVVMTTTHKTLRGPRSAIIMCKEHFAKAIDRAVFPGFQGGPHDHINAAKAIAFAEALKPEFKAYAKDNFVMLKADFPKKKTNKLEPAQQEKNNDLAEKYNKQGFFPLVVALDKNGNVLGKTGYKKMKPSEYIKLLSSF